MCNHQQTVASPQHYFMRPVCGHVLPDWCVTHEVVYCCCVHQIDVAFSTNLSNAGHQNMAASLVHHVQSVINSISCVHAITIAAMNSTLSHILTLSCVLQLSLETLRSASLIMI